MVRFSFTEMLLFDAFLLVFIIVKAVCDKHEKRLYDDLLKNYSSLERPVANNSWPVAVALQVSLQQIVDVVR